MSLRLPRIGLVLNTPTYTCGIITCVCCPVMRCTILVPLGSHRCCCFVISMGVEHILNPWHGLEQLCDASLTFVKRWHLLCVAGALCHVGTYSSANLVHAVMLYASTLADISVGATRGNVRNAWGLVLWKLGQPHPHEYNLILAIPVVNCVLRFRRAPRLWRGGTVQQQTETHRRGMGAWPLCLPAYVWLV